MGKRSRGARGRKKSGRTPVVGPSNGFGAGESSLTGTTAAAPDSPSGEASGGGGSASQAPAAKEPPTGFNRIPYFLHQEKKMSDLTAGILVTLAGGVLIIIVFYILILAWPAQ